MTDFLGKLLESVGGVFGVYSSVTELKIKLVSPKFSEFIIFPTSNQNKTILSEMSITESITTPVVSGFIILADHSNIVENLNLEGFEEIQIDFTKNKTKFNFLGIVTNINLMTDDAVLANPMNQEGQKHKKYSLSFMNKDLFLANQKTPQGIFSKNEFEIFDESRVRYKNRDFIGYIS